MKLKNYKIIKIKHAVKKNSFGFFFNVINTNSDNQTILKQSLKKIKFTCYQLYNKITNKALKTSIYKNTSAINGITLFVKPETNSNTFKNIINNNLKTLPFSLLSIKLNNKIYTTIHFKNAFSLKYTKIKLLFYQFKLINLKFYFNISK